MMTTFLVLALGAASPGDVPPGRTRPPQPALGAVVAGFAAGAGPGAVGSGVDRTTPSIVCAVFLRAGCPVADRAVAHLPDLAHRYEPRGVRFVGFLVGDPEPPTELDRFAADHRLGFPLVADDGAMAARLGATRTPEVVVLDPTGRIRYRGRVDDRSVVGSQRAEATRADLAEALDDLLAGRPVARPATPAVGCPIAPPAPSSAAGSSAPTYCHDVAPILERSCVACHRPGQVGPFALTTYREAVSRAGALVEAVEAGRMPPWHADPRHGRFANDIRLTDREREQVVTWVDAACPEGDPADLPAPVVRPAGWRIAEPDLIVAMPRPFLVPASGVVEYQYFEVDPGFTTDRWVQAAEIRPGNRRVVHHASVFLKPPGSGREPATQGELGSICLATMTPGTPPLTLPPGMAKRIPAGWHLLFVVHYAPIGTEQVDRTGIGLVFADARAVRREVATNLLVDPNLRIPPHAGNHRVEQSRRFEADVLLLAFFPHMHVRGKSFRYEATFPDGLTEILLDVPRFDFEWQNRYELAEPRRLPAGTILRGIAHYDNSAANPANPDPSATVRAGPQSWEEMFNGYYEIALADPDLTRPAPRWGLAVTATALPLLGFLGWRRTRGALGGRKV